MNGTYRDGAEENVPAVQPKGIPVVAEALGYVGGALALAAVITLLVRFWAPLGPYGHVGVGVVLALAGLVGGFTLERASGDAAKRLSQFLLAAGVVGVGVAAGFATQRIVQADAFNEWAWFVGMAAAAIAGGIVWWRRRTGLQHIVFGCSVASSALLVLPLLPVEAYEWGAGATLLFVGLVWGALSLRDLLEPRVVGLSLAALGIAGGIEMMVVSGSPMLRWAMWLGALTCVALIWAGSRLDEMGVLGVGTVALMLFSGQLVYSYLGFGAGTAIALIAVGFALLGAGVWLTLRLAPDTSRNRRIASEVAGYLGVALAMGGAGILVSEYWDELGVSGHIAVPLVGAVVAYACAWLLYRSEAAQARRLSQTLLAIGVLATGFTGAMIAQPIADNIFGEYDPDPYVMTVQIDYAETWTALVGALTAALAGGVTWFLRKGALTQAAFMVALIAVVTSAQSFFVWDRNNTPVMIAGAVLLVLGTLWVVFGALERITPVRTALVMGSVSALLGLQMLLRSDQGELNTWAGLLGVAYGIAGIVASIYLKRGTLLGFGAAFIILFATMLVTDLFGGRVGAPVMLLVLGVLFIVIAVVVARLAPRMRRTPTGPQAPQAPLAEE